MTKDIFTKFRGMPFGKIKEGVIIMYALLLNKCSDVLERESDGRTERERESKSGLVF